MALGLVCTEFNGQSLLVDTESGECVFYVSEMNGSPKQIDESKAKDLFNNLGISGDDYESVKEWMNW